MDIGQLIMNGFPRLATGNVADAGRVDIKIMDVGIKPLYHTMKVAGPAYTVETPPTAFLSILEAIRLAPSGSVLVINAHGNQTVGHLGDLIALACQVRKIAGIVIDGAVRDVEDIIKMGFPVFARGAIPHGNLLQAGTINQPIHCGGIQINPGDMIFADATGVLAFPQAKAQAIYDQAVVIANRELGLVQQINAGKTLLDIPEFLKMHGLDPAMLNGNEINPDSSK